MRLWTLHPKYLDARGLVALWREGLLAKRVLQGRTRGYRHHPQLERFRANSDPIAAINSYLCDVLVEAVRRGYSFDGRKVRGGPAPRRLSETRGQLQHEWRHLLAKLRVRAPERHRTLARIARPDAHPLFRVVPGGVRSWERATDQEQ
jgi:hypothetical protein